MKTKTFENNILERQYELDQINTDDHRYYLEKNTENPVEIKYPSITTVLSNYNKVDYSQIPRIVMEKAAERGTYMHDFCEKYILNELELPLKKTIDLKIAEPYNTAIGLFYQLKSYLDNSVESVLMSEGQLKSDKYRIAGTVDLFAKIKSKNIVVDYKSSTSRKTEAEVINYYMQLCFYAAAIEETFDIKVDGVIILISTVLEGVQYFYLDRTKLEHLPYEKELEKARIAFVKTKGF
ncbi:MAG: PD-(D/E)XK nuclease family protein [Mycoplasmataceae bacterium]|nr:PD-(D/E)XK nuclease family protein [Mycoplasmataceae bacterium]